MSLQDTNTFASASLDRSIKVWSLGSPTPNQTLEGHEKGVNCVDYYSGGERFVRLIVCLAGCNQKQWWSSEEGVQLRGLFSPLTACLAGSLVLR